MKKYSIIIQGEGKGHFTQAISATKILQDKGSVVKSIYVGKSFTAKIPDYFHSQTDLPIKTFFSPNFLRSTNRKGIRLVSSIVLNTLLSPIYIFEIIRLGILLIRDRSEIILNFFDPVGALAAKWFRRKATRIVLSHHFYLSHPDFIHPHGMEQSFFWLQFMNRVMMRSAHKVLALSFRKGEQFSKIRVIPPLIDNRLMKTQSESGDKDLCYFLASGFVDEAIEHYKNHPDQQVDIFCDKSIHFDIPENIHIHLPDRDHFLEKLAQCKNLICTAGFDLVAESFYLGKPVFLIPSENHYEQYCNALDASRTGMAFQLDSISDLDAAEFVPKNNKKYLEWLENNPPDFEN